MRDVWMEEKEKLPSAESTNPQPPNLESGDPLPEPLIQALEEALVNCRRLRFDPTTHGEEPQGDLFETVTFA